MAETSLRSFGVQPLTPPNRPSALSPMQIEGTPVLDRPPTRVDQPLVQPQSKQSALPTIIAIAAAAQGNLQPLFQLQEQKRKTQVFRQLQPVLGRASQFVEEGQYQEALDYLSQAYSQFGARAPEIGQFISQMQQRIANRQSNMHKLDTFVKAEKVIRKSAGESYPSWKSDLIDLIEVGLKGGKPADMAVVQSMMDRYRPHPQNITGAYRVFDPATRQVTTTPNVEVVQAQDFDTSEGRRLVGELSEAGYAFDPSSLANVFRGISTTDLNDNDLGELGIEWVRQRFAELQGETGLIEVSKNVPYDPITGGHLVNAVAQQRGISQQEALPIVASHTYSDEEDKLASRIALRDRTEVARAETMATADVNPNYKVGLGTTMFDKNNGAVVWNPGYTTNMGANNPNIGFLPTQTFEQDVKPLYIVRNQMSRLAQRYVNLLPDTVGLTGWLSEGLLSTVTGILPFDEVMAERRAIAAQLDSMMEQIPNPTNQQKSIMEALKKQVTNNRSTKEGAVPTLNEFLRSIQYTIDLRTRQGSPTSAPFVVPEITANPPQSIPSPGQPLAGPGATSPTGVIPRGQGLHDSGARRAP